MWSHVASAAASGLHERLRTGGADGSAGAGTSLWLAFHDDLADPSNQDPVLRESSRLVCAGALSAQFSYDMLKWIDVFGPKTVAQFGPKDAAPERYGLKSDADLRGPAGRKIRADCDLINLITPDDAPVFLYTTQPGGEITNRTQYLHHPKHSQLLFERCREIGVPAVLSIPSLGIAPLESDPGDLRAFLFQHLQPPTPAAADAPKKI